eukprot:13733299-Heterocapsa_arctica.AAC.1
MSSGSATSWFGAKEADEMVLQLQVALSMVSRGPRTVLIRHLEMSIEALKVMADQMRYQEEPEGLLVPLGCGSKPSTSRSQRRKAGRQRRGGRQDGRETPNETQVPDEDSQEAEAVRHHPE